MEESLTEKNTDAETGAGSTSDAGSGNILVAYFSVMLVV